MVEPVNMVTNWSKKFGCINGVAVLVGQGQISWLKGGNEKYMHTVQHIRTSGTNIPWKNNRNVDIAYSYCKNYLKLSLPFLESWLLHCQKHIFSVL